MTAESTFVATERARASAWKLATTTLPAGARAPAVYVGRDGVADGPSYDFCLPPEYAAYSLLPEVREQALALFAELGVRWHAGIGGGPSNHLLSSQVQCVNAVGPMVADPDRIVRAFGPILGAADVGQIEPGRWLTFECIGADDHFGDAVAGGGSDRAGNPSGPRGCVACIAHDIVPSPR